MEDSNLNFNFYNPENDLITKFNKDIHIHKNMRGTKKCTTIISGLYFSKEETKDFLSKIKKKFGIGGCEKMVEEVDTKNSVLVFMGDYREKIKNLLIEEYNKEDESIFIHG